MADFLSLPNLSTLSIKGDNEGYHIKAQGDMVPTACPSCKGSLHRHGSQTQRYLDIPKDGKRVLIEIDRKRFRCKVCGKTLFEPLPAVDGKRLATSRVIKHIERHCLQKSFAALSREVGVDDKTIRHIFDDYVSRLEKAVAFETPEVLGVGTLNLISKQRVMVTNVEKLTLFDLLPHSNKTDLMAYLNTLPDKDKVRILVVDLCNAYRQLAYAQFSGRLVVANRMCIMHMANDSMERVRKAVRKTLEPKDRLKLRGDRSVLLSGQASLSDPDRLMLQNWADMYPVLGAAHLTKENFHNIYSHTNKDDAQQAAKDWLQSIDKDVGWAFEELIETLKSWWNEIFNHYDYPMSNAYTESINSINKGISCLERGYSFDVVRARLLFDDGARRNAYTTTHKKTSKVTESPIVGDALDGASRMTAYDLSSEGAHKEVAVEYGPHLPTLAKKLKAVDFV